MTTLILVRHGESEANRKDCFAGWIDPPLLENGLKQGKLTAEYLAGNYKIDKIYSSDLQRAYKTALCLAEILNMEVTKNESLREINAGEWEDMKFSDVISFYADDFSVWTNDIGAAGCTGGETVKELGERIMAALREIVEENDGKTVAVFTHATPIRVAQSLLTTGGLREMQNIPWASNASATIVEYKDGKWNLVAAGLDEHLAEIRTALPSNV